MADDSEDNMRPSGAPESRSSRVRRDALARSIAARVHDDRRSEDDLRAVDGELIRREKAARHAALRVYVAAAATDSERVTTAIGALRSLGVEITCTWPEVVAKVGDANPRSASRLERFGWSTQDLAEVEEADVLWMLVPQPPLTTRGAWLEAGFAFARGKALVFSGDSLQSVFCSLGVEIADDVAAIDWIRRAAKRRRAAALADPVTRGLIELRDNAPVEEGGFLFTPDETPPPLPPAPPAAVRFDVSDLEDGRE